MATNLRPSKDDLCGCGTKPIGNLLDSLVLDKQRLAEHVVAEGGVLGDVDIVLSAPSDEVGLEETRVALDLVGGRNDTCAIDQSLQVFLSMVRNTYSASLLPIELGHSPPGIDD